MKLVMSDFDIATLEDELRVDALCRELLMAFYHEQLEAGLSEHSATLLANSADYFVRDYIIGARQLNLLETSADEVCKFAANWYIVNTLEPEIAELAGHLDGVQHFFRYLAACNAISLDCLSAIEQQCARIDYYDKRIREFLDIKGDGYYEWLEECPLKNG